MLCSFFMSNEKEKRSRDDVKLKLINSARVLFAQKGYNAVGIREIAKKAKVNSSLISYYFEGKEGLYKEIVSNHLKEHLQLIGKTESLNISPREKIFQAVSDHFGSKKDLEVSLMMLKARLLKKEKNSELNMSGTFCKTVSDLVNTMLSQVNFKSQYKNIIDNKKLVLLFMSIVDYSRFFHQNLVDMGIYNSQEEVENDAKKLLKDVINEFLN
jgi:AcrR family transcriptional regulator